MLITHLFFPLFNALHNKWDVISVSFIHSASQFYFNIQLICLHHYYDRNSSRITEEKIHDRGIGLIKLSHYVKLRESMDFEERKKTLSNALHPRCSAR